MSKTTTKTIQKRIWGIDDEYLVVPEIQVMNMDGFEEGDKVRVTIEKIKQLTIEQKRKILSGEIKSDEVGVLR